MDDVIRVIAQPVWNWLVDTAQVLVTAVPSGFAVAIPFFLFGGFIILAGYHYDYL